MLLCVGLSGCQPGAEPLTERAQRIASATLHTDELLLRMVPKERILSLSTAVDDVLYSPVRELAAFVRLRTPTDTEALAALGTDLVLVSGWVSSDRVAALQSLGVTVEVVPIPQTGEEIIEQTLAWGRKLGVEAAADALARQMRGIRDRAAVWKPSSPITILDVTSLGFSGGAGSLWNDMCLQAGLVNAAAELPADRWGMVSLGAERILMLDPDVLHVDREALDTVTQDPVFASLAAVENGRVVSIPAALRSSPGFGFWKAVEELQAAVLSLP